jgi:signal transduction histidine kinase
MDSERVALQRQNRAVKEALADSLHQLKNPLQALRTYGKLLQQRIADGVEEERRGPPNSAPLSSSSSSSSTTIWSSTRRGASAASTTPRLLELADHLMVQSDRLSQRLKPVDWIVDNMDDVDGVEVPRPPLLLLRPAEERGLVRWTGSIPAAEGSSSTRGSSALVPATASDSTNSKSKKMGEDSTDPSLGPGSVDESRFSEQENQRYLFDPSADDAMEIGFLEDVLEPVVSAFQAIADDKSIDFTVEIADDVPGVAVSVQAIQEVMSNLLDNAFKYVALSPSEGDAYPARPPWQPRVWLRITSNPSRLPPGATMYVEDNGPGIPDSELDAVFARGYRGAQSSSTTPGSGLGLGIARSLLHKMGGSIRALSPRKAAKRGCRLSGTVMEVVLYRNPPQVD